MATPLGITDVVLRDAHQSLLATRLRLEDMLPICPKLDKVGFWSLEAWGGATFDACIRYLGEDPWVRLRALKKALPNTRLQMLLRGQNLLGYRHYADDVVEKFVERSAENGVDVFRIFDALNDLRNFEKAIRAAIAMGKHAQGAISYTVSPVHTIDMWVDLSKRLEDMGAHSICIKDMAGLLKPYVAEELVGRLKQEVGVPIHMQCHATTGLSTAAIVKAVEAGIDNVDTAISSMSMTYGHSPTEAVVAIFQGHERDTGLDIHLLEEIAAYFREVRKKYARFEGSLKGVDSRILVAQVPGGMLTNMESQLKEQGALDRFDEVMQEIPRVREDLGFIPLVTPTSQIVGTQAVFNVLAGERYKTITKETAGVLRGEYGATPAPVNAELQSRVLKGDEPITCRPADLLAPELKKLTDELKRLAKEHGVKLSSPQVEDVLTYALFPQVGWRFLQNRDNPAAFEPPPGAEPAVPAAEVTSEAVAPDGARLYTVTVNGRSYQVEVAPGGAIGAIHSASGTASPSAAAQILAARAVSESVSAPVAGHVLRINVTEGQKVAEGQVVVVMEAMKMETEVRARSGGIVVGIAVKPGDTVNTGDVLVTLG
ncbi:sodium-extruding oxaloacetate decarboxylase subunit alpha [Methylococcus capsulatus]|jgi:oxaloacetate decarboxylase alpha subunit|uniref:Oxaloacetate decarboxylase alpha chain n=1 Tax=Methylococcus capsulatus TaxID=414 RepID=A0AA35ULB2_METCP|nr:sodium-extruding oxaloacetate decarboxylase subunit alpha [Methylococcus capsulatus]QXP86949.1 sodium-extruding oxaloacetate decarboxylase subunit alpha [Methylococcus capsulatus]QXP91704.1 sodium-extruding oxaloacetate decarboxylase subunit alpha [Methylococcus capsulatus]QXP93371.1 sodium-extruding oxaloacetate decarboxylase subunit alpha [Methylococcus capsulatus]CAI8829364.1 Oxaloacetate decarboxylase alpha chain [Methylococcus capsulatus]